MTPHSWELQRTPLDDFPDIIGQNKKSDVWLCRRCCQITLSEIGKPADDTLFGTVLPCDEAIVKQVLES